ncbi:GNAT family N-acetyltransferase [Paenibacillus thermotolerans]|uniref:GNAT family N-acetyltransferase n=1 Tax=Paenibacillus thermotolerans TaxID=3027807 RepID=UPI00236877AD|nr:MULTISPECIES: GNAT family N-acetyltransferase [unclassified Paenibacillus]
MLRKRIPKVDDKAIFALIRKELIPLNPPEWQKGDHSDKRLTERLKLGTTLVWSQARHTPALAFIHIYPLGPVLFVDLLAVDGKLQRRGIGSVLLDEAEKHGRAWGHTRLQLLVNETNAKGIRFYMKKGMSIARYEPMLRSYLMDKAIV